MYAVKELCYTLQGEGYHTGRPAVFLRFAGCNLWSGLERDRSTAICNFCDTDFVGVDGPGGGKFATAEQLAAEVVSAWNGGGTNREDRFTVLTGGEPLLQLDAPLIAALHGEGVGFEIAIETNGTITAPPELDWICVSPKAEAEFVQRSGNELKLIFPQEGIDPAEYTDLPFDHFFLQPMDGPAITRNTELVTAYCDAHSQWKVSLQTHKILGIP